VAQYEALAPTKYALYDALFIGADKVSMASSEISAAFIGPVQPLQLSVELLANLIYVARRTGIHSASSRIPPSSPYVVDKSVSKGLRGDTTPHRRCPQPETP
jgi:hypothetical protein